VSYDSRTFQRNLPRRSLVPHLIYPNDGGYEILRNVGTCAPDNTSSLPTKWHSSPSFNIFPKCEKISFTLLRVNSSVYLDGWLTVHRSITLVDFQLDAQNSYFLYIILLLKSSTCFEHYPAHLQEAYVVIVYMQLLVLSLSAGDCPVHRLRKKLFLMQVFLNRCTRQSPADSNNTRGCKDTITT
jgi:hypothetical protein